MTDTFSSIEPESTKAPAGKAGKKKRGRIGEILGVLVIIGLVVGIAFYQETISSFFVLRLWDKSAPGNTVASFLAAGKKGDQKAADSYLGSSDFHALNKNGKWQGYFIVTPAGKIEFTFDDLAPNAAPADVPTNFLTIGKGAAEVMMPSAGGKPVKYRLEMKDGAWKITEILGGHASH